MYYIWCIKIVFKLAPSEKFLGFAGCIKKEQTMYRKQYDICAIIKRKKRFYYARSQHSARKNS